MSNCQFLTLGVKLSAVSNCLRCQIVLPAFLVSNCPRCQIVLESARAKNITYVPLPIQVLSTAQCWLHLYLRTGGGHNLRVCSRLRHFCVSLSLLPLVNPQNTTYRNFSVKGSWRLMANVMKNFHKFSLFLALPTSIDNLCKVTLSVKSFANNIFVAPTMRLGRSSALSVSCVPKLWLTGAHLSPLLPYLFGTS